MTPPHQPDRSLPALIDVRAESEFLQAHARGAANFPLEELARRAHELPPGSEHIRVTDSDVRRAEEAAATLRQRGHPVTIVPFEPLTADEDGPSRIRLWRPNAFLVEAIGIIKSRD